MAGGVAVGAGTRAFREGFRPGGPPMVGGTPGAFGATGTGSRAYREGWRSGATPFVPPAGSYEPRLDVEEAAGKHGNEQLLSGYQRQRANAQTDYATNLSLLGQREANEKRQQSETLANLAQSYQRLGVRQNEQANSSGVLGGGALLASAQRRAENEGQAKGADEARFREQGQGNEDQRGKLANSLAELLGSGGTLTEAQTNAQLNENEFENNIRTLKNTQAAAHGQGYVQPPANSNALHAAMRSKGRRR